MKKGYQSDNYTKTYESQGRIRRLNYQFNGYVLERDIPSTPYKDISSIYPLYPFRITSIQEPSFREPIETNIVSILLVTDPLQLPLITSTSYPNDVGVDTTYSHPEFNVVKKYKDHYIVKLQEPLKIAENHRRNIKKALFNNGVEVTNITLHDETVKYHSNSFFNLYSNLAKRHNITGVSNFNCDQLLNQLRVPGACLFRASLGGYPVGYVLFYIEGDNVRYHLGCYSDLGYESNASFAIMYEAINFFKQLGLNQLVLGGSSGAGAKDGLDRFKAGWTSYTQPAFILFKVTQPTIYDKLCEGKSGDYLPLYRS